MNQNIIIILLLFKEELVSALCFTVFFICSSSFADVTRRAHHMHTCSIPIKLIEEQQCKLSYSFLGSSFLVYFCFSFSWLYVNIRHKYAAIFARAVMFYCNAHFNSIIIVYLFVFIIHSIHLEIKSAYKTN